MNGSAVLTFNRIIYIFFLLKSAILYSLPIFGTNWYLFSAYPNPALILLSTHPMISQYQTTQSNYAYISQQYSYKHQNMHTYHKNIVTSSLLLLSSSCLLLSFWYREGCERRRNARKTRETWRQKNFRRLNHRTAAKNE